MIPRCGHNTYEQRPREYVPALLAFLKRVGKGRNDLGKLNGHLSRATARGKLRIEAPCRAGSLVETASQRQRRPLRGGA